MSRLGLPRLPATISLVGVLLIAALATDTVTSPLTTAWLLRVGFAPVDLLELDFSGVFTSALVTRGASTLVIALCMTGFSVGMVERSHGWRTALLIFWGAHILTLVLMGLVLNSGLHASQSPLLVSLATARGVGPSAGYLGSLGFGLSMAGGRLRRIGGGVMVVWLALDFMGVVRIGDPLPTELSADLAHLIAFASGWMCWLLLSFWQGTRSSA